MLAQEYYNSGNAAGNAVSWVFALAGIGLSIFVLYDALRRPDWVWPASGQSKTLWIVLGVVGIFPGCCCGLIGIVIGAIYLASIRSKLDAVQSGGGGGFGGPGYGPSGYGPPPGPSGYGPPGGPSYGPPPGSPGYGPPPGAPGTSFPPPPGSPGSPGYGPPPGSPGTSYPPPPGPGTSFPPPPGPGTSYPPPGGPPSYPPRPEGPSSSPPPSDGPSDPGWSNPPR